MLGSRRGVALPLQHGVSLAWAWVPLSLLCVGLCHQLGREGPGLKVAAAAVGKCIEREREVLLAVRDGIWYALNYNPPPFSSWEKSGDDCCLWEGVGCDGRSGHVVKLDLRGPPPPSIDDDDGSPYFYIYLETMSYSKDRSCCGGAEGDGGGGEQAEIDWRGGCGDGGGEGQAEIEEEVESTTGAGGGGEGGSGGNEE